MNHSARHVDFTAAGYIRGPSRNQINLEGAPDIKSAYERTPLSLAVGATQGTRVALVAGRRS